MADFYSAFEAVTTRNKDKIAIYDRGREVSFSELLENGSRLASGLRDIGIAKGDRIGVWLPNITAYLEIFIACARIGAIVVSVNTKFKSTEVEDIVGRSGCKALILWPDFKDIPFMDLLSVTDPAHLADLETLIFYNEEQGQSRELPGFHDKKIQSLNDLYTDPLSDDDRCDPDDGLVIFTTSGTTGKPKFVLHTHYSITEHATDVIRGFAMEDPATTILQALPLCGTFGLTQSLAGLMSASRLILMSVFDGLQAARFVQQQHVTHMNGADDMADLMLQAVPEPLPFPSLKFFGYAAFNPKLKDIVETADSRGLKMVGLYGMSECQALLSCQSATAPIAQRKLGGGKLSSSRARVRIRNTETGELCNPGDAGEVEIKSPSLMLEYFGNAKATAECFTKDGFLRTGDLGYQDARDSFVFLSRMGDVLRLGGFLVSPVEIEECLQNHPAVERAQVVGIETPKGTRPVAFVISSGDPDVDDIRDFVKARLAHFKVPVAIHRLDRFPTTDSANGIKIQRSELKKTANAEFQKTSN